MFVWWKAPDSPNDMDCRITTCYMCIHINSVICKCPGSDCVRAPCGTCTPECSGSILFCVSPLAAHLTILAWCATSLHWITNLRYIKNYGFAARAFFATNKKHNSPQAQFLRFSINFAQSKNSGGKGPSFSFFIERQVEKQGGFLISSFITICHFVLNYVQMFVVMQQT